MQSKLEHGPSQVQDMSEPVVPEFGCYARGQKNGPVQTEIDSQKKPIHDAYEVCGVFAVFLGAGRNRRARAAGIIAFPPEVAVLAPFFSDTMQSVKQPLGVVRTDFGPRIRGTTHGPSRPGHGGRDARTPNPRTSADAC